MRQIYSPGIMPCLRTTYRAGTNEILNTQDVGTCLGQTVRWCDQVLASGTVSFKEPSRETHFAAAAIQDIYLRNNLSRSMDLLSQLDNLLDDFNMKGNQIYFPSEASISYIANRGPGLYMLGYNYITTYDFESQHAIAIRKEDDEKFYLFDSRSGLVLYESVAEFRQYVSEFVRQECIVQGVYVVSLMSAH